MHTTLREMTFTEYARLKMGPWYPHATKRREANIHGFTRSRVFSDHRRANPWHMLDLWKIIGTCYFSDRRNGVGSRL